MDIVLKEAEVRKYIIEGLRAQGLEASAEQLVMRQDENGEEFVVEARNVAISIPVERAAPAAAVVPKKGRPAPSARRVIDIPDVDPDAKDDGTPMAAILEEGDGVRLNKMINPRADAAALGGRAFRDFAEVDIDPEQISRDELYPGINPNRKS
jgi:hypothetical protein